VLLVLSAVIVIFTGKIAEQVGRALGVESVFVTTWGIAKWPVLVVLVSLMLAILYWASPNARQGGIRWVSPGGVVAVLLWIAASAGFAIYVGNFASYNKTYGTLAGVVVFLVWLWISNLAILYGAELNAELERQRSAAAGHPADEEPYLQLRDSRKVREGQDKDLSG
jgi:membrane protein